MAKAEWVTRKTLDKSVLALFPKISPEDEETRQRLNALNWYVDMKPIKELAQFGVGLTSVLDMYNRALQIHDDGRLVGYRACKKFTQLMTGKTASGRRHGPFLKFLYGTHPELAELRRLIDLERKKKKKNAAHFWREIFLPFCKNNLGLTENDYPLNTSNNTDQSYTSLKRLIHTPIKSNVEIQETPDEASEVSSNILRLLMHHAYPLQILQYDECKVDLAGVAKVRDAAGEVHYIPFDDATVLVLVDAFKPIVWAWTLFFHPVAGQEDMLLLLSRTDVPWQRVQVKPGRRNYQPGATMPSAAFPVFIGAQGTLLMGDRAMAHKAFKVSMVERSRRGLTLHFGPGHRPIVRDRIEGLFSMLDRSDFHNQPNTYGTGKEDPRHSSGVPNAIAMAFDDEDLLAHVDVAITDHFVKGHGGKKSGLSYLGDLLKHDPNFMVRTLPPPIAGSPSIGEFSVWVKVKKSKHGPCVEHYARWYGNALTRAKLGDMVELRPTHGDVRFPGVLIDGVHCGNLHIGKAWRSNTPVPYANLKATEQQKSRNRFKDPPSRSKDDLQAEIANLELAVAATPRSKRRHPSKDASELIEKRAAAAAATNTGSPTPDEQESAARVPSGPSTEPARTQAASPPALANDDSVLAERVKPQRPLSSTVVNEADDTVLDIPEVIRARIESRKLFYRGRRS